MALTSYSYTYYPWEINPEELKHRYYVRLSHDRERLVPGILQQDTKPAPNGWLDVTAIDRSFPERYFCQYTDFNTLVPGSLIQSDKLPKGKWKEIKKPRMQFHRVSFSDPYMITVPHSQGPFHLTLFFTMTDDFLIQRVNPALRAVYPDLPVLPYLDTWIPGSVNVRFNLYYFKGTFAELGNDKTKLISFNTQNLSIGGGPNGITAWERKSFNFLSCSDLTPAGSYCFILAILDAQNNEKDYVVLENILIRT
jgi:hypothetical protein